MNDENRKIFIQVTTTSGHLRGGLMEECFYDSNPWIIRAYRKQLSSKEFKQIKPRPELEKLVMDALDEGWKSIPVAVRKLTEWGYSQRQVSKKLGISLKRVRRLLGKA